MPKQIIAFTGRIGVGKSLAAATLADQGYTRTRFAGPLKDMMRVLGLTDEHIEGELKEVPCPLLCGRTPRYAMQTIGTEWGRDIMGKDLWVNVWQYRVLSMPDEALVTVEDCRFPNEAEAVRAVGGIIVRIVRPQFVERGRHVNGHDLELPRSPLPEGVTHESEHQEFPADFTIDNDGSIGQFLQTVRSFKYLKYDDEGHPYFEAS